jgi:cation diffusion facilitator CzcD-associated flavoprotein CzcO
MHAGLKSNIDARTMSYTQEPFPLKLVGELESASVDKNTPFRKSEVIREWVDGLVSRNNYRDLVEFNTTVEKAEKIGSEWVLTLRKSLPGGSHNYWWQESFDALIVASGHYSIPNIPNVPGLVELEEHHPGTVEHSKGYRGPENYRNKVIAIHSYTKRSILICFLPGRYCCRLFRLGSRHSNSHNRNCRSHIRLYTYKAPPVWKCAL